MARRENREEDDWARQVPWERSSLPYQDYGWEPGESVLPEFRGPDVHLTPHEMEEVRRKERELHGLSRGPFSGIGPRNYTRSDEHIFDDVCDRLTIHGQVDASDIEVYVDHGEVTLEGTVNDRWMKRMAEDAALSVPGVKDVQNRLRLISRTEEKSQQLQQEESKPRGRPRKRPAANSGQPGGGRGRKDVVKGSGVYPASGPLPKGNAETHPMASWGQGERGPEGYQDHGESELPMPGEGDAMGKKKKK